MRKLSLFSVTLLIVAIAFASGCAKRQLTKSESDRINAIEAKIAKAMEMGAKECDPKKLAQAIAALDHAKHELTERYAEGSVEEMETAEKIADELLANTQVCWDAKQKRVPTVSFTANPPMVDKGNCSTLSWTSTDATEASIDNAVGEVAMSGSRDVCPPQTTTYTISVAGPGGSITSSVTVNITPSMTSAVLSEFVIFFDFDKSFIREDAKPVLEKLGTYLKGHKDVKILIEGHCDERGTNEYNFALGERRSQAAKNYLTDLGVDGSRLKTISYGEERPADPGHEEEAWAKNRRDQFVEEK